MVTVLSYISLLVGALVITLVVYLGLLKIKLIQFIKSIYIREFMVEALLSGIVLGLVPVTITGLFVTAYLQYRRGDQLNL